jgi:plastocyanin
MPATLRIAGNLAGGASNSPARYLWAAMAGKPLVRTMITLAAVAALGAAIVVSGASGSAKAPVQVSAKDNFFDPAKVKIGQGEKVQWTNEGSEDHSVKLKGEKDTIFAPGESISKRFKKLGRYSYVCTLHAGMDGKVVVKDVR